MKRMQLPKRAQIIPKSPKALDPEEDDKEIEVEIVPDKGGADERVQVAAVEVTPRIEPPADLVITNGDLPEVQVALDVYFAAVDDANETFIAELKIHALYSDVSLITPNANAADVFERIDAGKFRGFLPSFQVDQYEGKKTSEEDFFVTTSINRCSGMIWTVFKNTFTIGQYLQLSKFPFDRQIFYVNVSGTNCVAVAWNSDPKSTAILGFTGADEQGNAHSAIKFKLDHKNASANQATQRVLGSPKGWEVVGARGFLAPRDDTADGLAIIGTAILAQRIPWFYGFNFVVVIFFIVATNVCVVAVDPFSSSDRNSLSITLLLTLVAFKFVLMQGVPKLTYMTYMDKYVFLSFLFIIASIAENVALPLATKHLDKDDDEKQSIAELTDYVFQGIYLAAWVLVNILVLLTMIFPNIIRPNWKRVNDALTDESFQSVALATVVHNTKTEPNIGL